MDAPRYTVIVPMLRYGGQEPVLASLRETRPLSETLEILVAEGSQPARQRNAALERARGDIIVFLDNDCRLGPYFWSELQTTFDRPEVEVAGGPALLRPEATSHEAIFHALLTHPLLVGSVSARYSARGNFRPSQQSELILCNLAARRSLFSKIGLFSPRLYPNEENEWLDRATKAPTGIYYNPKLQVFRPQRSTWGQFFTMLLRYGKGRTRQFWVSGGRSIHYQLLPLMLLVPIMSVRMGSRYEIAFCTCWLLVSLFVALTCDRRLKIGQKIVSGLVAPLIPLTYTLGQLLGWPALLIPRQKSTRQIRILNERGEQLESL